MDNQIHRLGKYLKYYVNDLSHHNIDNVIPAITKSVGFTGILARLTKSSLFHSK